jgi:hypothetical protein
MQTLTEAASAIQAFQNDNLGERIAVIEIQLKELDAQGFRAELPHLGINDALMEAALTLKVAAGQVNVIIHALGILLTVPKILGPGERVTNLSIGAGSTGKPFDLETTHRVAEFKFISWKGGSEAIRQNSLFKDFYLLAEHPSEKLKELYVIGKEYPHRFLQGRRKLSSVMSRNNKLWEEFKAKYQGRFSVVSDYYEFRKAEVSIRDLRELLPALGVKPTSEAMENP